MLSKLLYKTLISSLIKFFNDPFVWVQSAYKLFQVVKKKFVLRNEAFKLREKNVNENFV